MEYDSEQPVIGYRRWQRKSPSYGIPQYSLVGSYRDAVWPPFEVMEGECLAYRMNPGCPRGPLTQHTDCQCGLHVWFTLEDAKGYTVTGGSANYVIGIAWGGGRVLFDNKFCRCEFGGALCLIDPHEYGPLIRKEYKLHSGDVYTEKDVTEDVSQWASRVSDRYEIPLLSHADAVEYASQFGRWVWGVKDLPDGSVIVEGVDDV